MSSNAPEETIEIYLDDDRSLTIPPRIGRRYEFVRCVGNGSCSAVVLVRDVVDGQFYACKVVARAMLVEENLLTRFEQELRILQHLRHPHIVAVREVVYSQANIYLVMEYCENGELFRRIVDEGELAEREAKRLFRELVGAVGFIHTRSIAHRDLKPENILLDGSQQIKLCDFGLCHVTSAAALLKTPCGSPFYAPPEIISNAPYDGKCADVWSLGIVLYTMTTGALPWRDLSPGQLFAQIQRADISVPSFLSASLRQLIKAMTARDPRLRPTCEQVLNSAWLREDEIYDAVNMNSNSYYGRSPRQQRKQQHSQYSQQQQQLQSMIELPTRKRAAFSGISPDAEKRRKSCGTVKGSLSQPAEIVIQSFKTQIKVRQERENQLTSQRKVNETASVSSLPIKDLLRRVPPSGRRQKTK